MRAISLWQPWASLWCSPRKIHETRHWSTDYRGWLAVHAAKRFEKNHPPELASVLRAQFGEKWFKTLPTGAVIGVVRLTGCMPTDQVPERYDGAKGTRTYRENLLCGDFSPGRFAWERGGFHLFEKPVPFRGLQGFFNVPDELLPVISVLEGTT